MSLEKCVNLSQIEITRLGVIQVRFDKQVVDGGQVISSEYHRTAVPPGGDISAQLTAVNAHLDSMGWPGVSVADIQRIADHAAVAWTSDVIAAFQARQAAAFVMPSES